MKRTKSRDFVFIEGGKTAKTDRELYKISDRLRTVQNIRQAENCTKYHTARGPLKNSTDRQRNVKNSTDRQKTIKNQHIQTEEWKKQHRQIEECKKQHRQTEECKKQYRQTED
jgi:hypothetical protein